MLCRIDFNFFFIYYCAVCELLIYCVNFLYNILILSWDQLVKSKNLKNSLVLQEVLPHLFADATWFDILQSNSSMTFNCLNMT